MVNITSLNDLKKEDQKKEERVYHYTGGQKSGLEVENSDDEAGKDFFSKKVSGNCRKITLYKNGFIVDGGEFRDLSIEANQKFVDDIEAGYLPLELADKKGNAVNVALNDKRNIMFVPQKKEEKAPVYVGTGRTLVGNKISDIDAEEIKRIESLPATVKEIDVDEAKPLTHLQIRLYTGKKIQHTFNRYHTVQDMYEAIYNITPVNFSLLYDFPLKEIPRSDLTLEEAKLIDVTITQKLL